MGMSHWNARLYVLGGYEAVWESVYNYGREKLDDDWQEYWDVDLDCSHEDGGLLVTVDAIFRLRS